jgi:aminoglycoside phosphotransferase
MFDPSFMHDLLTSLPRDLALTIGPVMWVPVLTGESGASVFRLTDPRRELPDRFLKISPTSDDDDLRQEMERLTWLRGRLPVPEVLGYGVGYRYRFLLISAVPGQDASVERFSARPGKLVEALATGLRLIHSVDPLVCPFLRPLDVMIDRARVHVEAGRVDEADFDDVRQGRSAREVFDQLLADRPPIEERAFVHGDYCLPNILLDPASMRVTGFIDWGRAGVADPYQDLALAARSVIYNIGARWVDRFFDAYGLKPVDHARVRYYQLLDEFF